MIVISTSTLVVLTVSEFCAPAELEPKYFLFSESSSAGSTLNSFEPSLIFFHDVIVLAVIASSTYLAIVLSLPIADGSNEAGNRLADGKGCSGGGEGDRGRRAGQQEVFQRYRRRRVRRRCR